MFKIVETDFWNFDFSSKKITFLKIFLNKKSPKYRFWNIGTPQPGWLNGDGVWICTWISLKYRGSGTPTSPRHSHNTCKPATDVPNQFTIRYGHLRNVSAVLEATQSRKSTRSAQKDTYSGEAILTNPSHDCRLDLRNRWFSRGSVHPVNLNAQLWKTEKINQNRENPFK